MMYYKAKRNDLLFEILRSFLAISIAIVIVVITIFFVSGRPFEALNMLFLGPLATVRRIGNIFEFAIPLIFTGLALALIFRARQFNLAVDGAFYAGAMACTLVGLYLKMPPAIVIFLGLLAGAVVGGMLGAIPAIIKEKLGAMELVTSLMLNYAVGFVVLFILTNFIRSPISMTLESIRLPREVNLMVIIPGTRIHLGLIFAIVCVALASIFLYRTKWGYALRITGSNREFAHYSGIPDKQVVIWTQIAGCALAGFGGATDLLGLYTSFRWNQSPLYGFDGIIIAALAKQNPMLVPIAALFLAYVRVGADILNRSGEVPFEIVSIVQATIILLIAATGFLKGLKQKNLERQIALLEKATEGGKTV